MNKLQRGNWPIREEPVCCGLLRVRKIGNIYVLAEYGERRLVLGPYWHFLLVTLVMLAAINTIIYVVVLPAAYEIERVIGLSLAILAILSLICTAVTDPGVFPRYSRPLADDWTYSEYAQSFRPPGVVYCQQSHLLIEDYNHFCPWSGTVIGKGNEVYFQVFISAIILSLIFDVLVVVLSLYHVGA